jgi:hypothetical protein
MLEQKIEQLTASINNLTGVIMALNQILMDKPAVATQPAQHPTEAQTSTQSAQQQVAPDQVSRDDVQELCMTLVRANRALKNAVRDAIAEFDGAATLKDVKESDLAALKIKLETLR